MSAFNLINDLNNPSEKPSEPVSTIKYQSYIVEVDQKDVTVKVPNSAAKDFEREIAELTENITKRKLTYLLRNHRAIRG